MTEHDDFEAPATYSTEITIRDKTRRYLIAELSDADVATTFRITDAKGNRDARLVDTFNARVIAKCVRREDGTAITLDEAKHMRQPLAQALVKAVLKVHQLDESADAQIDEAEKN